MAPPRNKAAHVWYGWTHALADPGFAPSSLRCGPSSKPRSASRGIYAERNEPNSRLSFAGLDRVPDQSLSLRALVRRPEKRQLPRHTKNGHEHADIDLRSGGNSIHRPASRKPRTRKPNDALPSRSLQKPRRWSQRGFPRPRIRHFAADLSGVGQLLKTGTSRSFLHGLQKHTPALLSPAGGTGSQATALFVCVRVLSCP